MLMADPATAVAETRPRATAWGAWRFRVGAPEPNPWAAIAARILAERGRMPPREPEGVGIFAIASERGHASACSTGRFSPRCARKRYRCGSPEREALTAEVQGAFTPFVSDGRYELPDVALCALAS
jgi:hypothetical protein